MRKSNWQSTLAGIPTRDALHVMQAKGRTALTLRLKNPIWKIVLLVAWAVWLLDLLTKTWALVHLEGKNDVKILGDFLKLTLAKNSGAAFSMGESGTLFLTLFSITVIFLIGYWTPKVTSRSWALVMALVLGGSLGNLTDRIFREGNGSFQGHVIDWIALPHWPIFNLADSAIVIAAVLATFLSFRNVTPNAPHTNAGKTKDEDVHGA